MGWSDGKELRWKEYLICNVVFLFGLEYVFFVAKVVLNLFFLGVFFLLVFFYLV